MHFEKESPFGLLVAKIDSSKSNQRRSGKYFPRPFTNSEPNLRALTVKDKFLSQTQNPLHSLIRGKMSPCKESTPSTEERSHAPVDLHRRHFPVGEPLGLARNVRRFRAATMRLDLQFPISVILTKLPRYQIVRDLLHINGPRSPALVGGQLARSTAELHLNNLLWRGKIGEFIANLLR